MKYRVQVNPGIFFDKESNDRTKASSMYNVAASKFVQYVADDDGHQIWDIDCSVRDITSMLMDKAITLVYYYSPSNARI